MRTKEAILKTVSEDLKDVSQFTEDIKERGLVGRNILLANTLEVLIDIRDIMKESEERR